MKIVNSTFFTDYFPPAGDCPTLPCRKERHTCEGRLYSRKLSQVPPPVSDRDAGNDSEGPLHRYRHLNL